MQKHPHHDRAAKYRRQAQEIRTIVQKVSIDEAREQLLETAERLETLAEEEERKVHGLNRGSPDLDRKD